LKISGTFEIFLAAKSFPRTRKNRRKKRNFLSINALEALEASLLVWADSTGTSIFILACYPVYGENWVTVKYIREW
jgi:hypothetical protein